MKLEPEQRKYMQQLVDYVLERFPDSEFLGPSPSPDDPETVLLDFTRPETDERYFEITEYANVRALDILLDHGYDFLVMPTEPRP